MDSKSGIFTAIFWKRTAERMVRAFAGGLVGTTIISAGWKQQLIAAAGVSLTSLVISLVGSQIGDGTDPSLIKPEPPKE